MNRTTIQNPYKNDPQNDSQFKCDISNTGVSLIVDQSLGMHSSENFIDSNN